MKGPEFVNVTPWTTIKISQFLSSPLTITFRVIFNSDDNGKTVRPGVHKSLKMRGRGIVKMF